MSISPGSNVGPYEVLAPLGEGAMGVVFRARDSRLQRDVALKLLPEHFANDPDRLSRFQREAQVLASLNHANIAQIYGLEQVNSSICIVMELVEGETLEDRLKKGRLSYDETLDITRQLADALAAAHERGVVHRDLKPANIKLTPSGTVKVLDFGLAKALGPKASDSNMSTMPTVAGGSLVGTVVGTPGYMSPEQARGKEVDARTDIWAFGCVLYEMLTARKAFGGETITDVMAKIVTSPPDLDLLPPDTPRSMRLLLTSALDKNASHRLQHIGDSRLFLEGPLVADASKPDTAPRSRGLRGKLVPAALLIALAAAAVPAVLYFRDASRPVQQMRLELTVPQLVGATLLSPNGQWIAYAAQPADGKRALWLRPVDSDAAQQVPGTEDVNGAIWSPDSKKIAFLAGGKLKKIDVAGGSPQPLADVGGVRGGDWNRSGVILVARTSDGVISRISDAGGALTPITKLDGAQKDVLHGLPTFLPDGNRFLYVAVAVKPEESGIFVGSLDPDKPSTRVVALQPNRFNGLAYASGTLLFLNNGKLTAQRLTSRGDAVEGEPVVLAEDVDNTTFSVSQNGLLTYRKATPMSGKQLLWFDRQGKEIGQVGSVKNYGSVDLSPKGDRAAVDVTENNRDVWVIDLARAVPSRITFDAGSDGSPSWSPDGTRVVFASARPSGITEIAEKSATGAGAQTSMLPDNAGGIPVHSSPDGKYIVFSRNKQNANGNDTFLLPLLGERKAIPFLETPFDKFQARVSPDSHLVAYSTNETGMYQIVVQTFPDPTAGKWQITADGGVEPKWRHDGRELYYLALDGKLMAVSISGSGSTLQAGRPESLFQTPLNVNRTQPTRDRRYDVSADGRFLMVIPAASTAALPVTVVVNWDTALPR